MIIATLGSLVVLLFVGTFSVMAQVGWPLLGGQLVIVWTTEACLLA
jgi:hypothetical protein